MHITKIYNINFVRNICAPPHMQLSNINDSDDEANDAITT